MLNPKISIVTITYNSERTLEETILSVVTQDYPNLEYIIMDGGSKDRTLEIVDKYRDKISFVISEPDKGISDAFNKGIRYATGEIIGIINSDDILLGGTLNTLAKNYNPNVDVYSMNVVLWDDINNHKVREIPTVTNLNCYNMSVHVAHQGRFVTKKAYEKWGCFDGRLKYMMDWDLLVRFYKSNAVFQYINHDAALYRLGATTSDNIKKKKNDVRILVENNKGNRLSFIYIWSIFKLRNYMKNILDFLFGENFKRMIRYREYDNK